MTVSAKEILAEAEALRETIISDRRALHAAPEAGADLPRTREYVAGRLREMGYEPKELAGGITAEITGSDTGNCVLLRADMDALCVTEQTDLPFRLAERLYARLRPRYAHSDAARCCKAAARASERAEWYRQARISAR